LRSRGAILVVVAALTDVRPPSTFVWGRRDRRALRGVRESSSRARLACRAHDKAVALRSD
jgi:hypothetical protein